MKYYLLGIILNKITKILCNRSTSEHNRHDCSCQHLADRQLYQAGTQSFYCKTRGCCH